MPVNETHVWLSKFPMVAMSLETGGDPSSKLLKDFSDFEWRQLKGHLIVNIHYQVTTPLSKYE